MQGWNDYHLTWNESDYAGVKSIRIPAELLWKPDILMYNRSSFVQCCLAIINFIWQISRRCHIFRKDTVSLISVQPT